MIKILVHIWIAVIALAGFLVSCNRASVYDQQLVAADSLLRNDTQRDTALALLTAIKPNSLSNEADRAYHALLLTQARYKCYCPTTQDDSVNINTATAYYKSHDGEREHEKLIRSYIYKGAVMEELGYPDSAMTYYKQAEVNAHPKDYFNLGFARLRMGKLYARYHAYDGKDIEKLELALDCFKQNRDTTYQIFCLRDLGSLYRRPNPSTAESMLKNAISLASKADDKENFILSTNSLAYLYFMQEKYDSAYQQLQHIRPLPQDPFYMNCYFTFAEVYAKCGKPDSAMMYLKASGYDGNTKSSSRTNYLEALSHIALAKGDSVSYWRLNNESYRQNSELISDINKLNIMNAENNVQEQHDQEIEKQQQRRMLAVLAVSLLLLALAALFYRRAHRYDKLVLELKDRSQSQIQDLSGLQDNLNELKINDERLKGFISSHMGMMREMIEACYHEPNNRIAENMKRIVKFQDSNRDNWVKLYDYIDMEHNNIMTSTREKYPQLNDRDLLLLALSCMGYSYIQTAIIMGYSNATSVSVIKQRLAKKMGIDCSLNEYIEQYEQQTRQ